MSSYLPFSPGFLSTGFLQPVEIFRARIQKSSHTNIHVDKLWKTTILYPQE
jgi:hypothetical protein